jgi:hypothetical protein
MKNDIVFVTYGEQNAEQNWNKLVSRFPYAKRVSNVKGIYNAYKTAADNSETDYFFVVDADNIILDDFNFDYTPSDNSFGTFVWQAKNPVNQLAYGYGGLKMYKKSEFYAIENLPKTLSNPYDFMSFNDFPITSKIKFIKEIASLTHFNSSPFDAWKAAFRECCKLASFGIHLGLSEIQLADDKKRLGIWCTTGKDKPFGEWVILGAEEGKLFGLANINNISELAKINDYNWLRQYFIKKYNYVFS